MRITKTWFKTEIEFQPDELIALEKNFQNSIVRDIVSFLKKLLRR